MSATPLAREVVDRLADRQMRIVLAESCTGGMISAELAKVPGVSQWLCGSAVTYRSPTKVEWLSVDAGAIEKHTAVSRQVASQMASGVLDHTTEASIAASITGHFGPDAPDGFDGVVFIGIAFRRETGTPDVEVVRHQLTTSEREQRQAEAVDALLRLVLKSL